MVRFRRIVLVVAVATLTTMAACTPPDEGGDGPVHAPPVAHISITLPTGDVPVVVTFDGSRSSDPAGRPLTYAWDFGNGDTSTEVTAFTTYTTRGSFTVTLTVTEPGGSSGAASVTVNTTGGGDDGDLDGDGYQPPLDCDDSDSTIHPGALDVAGDDIDQDCDGIDGTIDAVFVSADSGTDDDTCGPMERPCATIAWGIDRAPDLVTDQVYVSGGNYPGFHVVEGIDVIGGYGQDWQRGPTAAGSTAVIVDASFDASIGAPVAVVARGITANTRIAHMTIRGATADAGQNSYALHVVWSGTALVFDSVDVIGGTAGSGSAGSNGIAGWTGAAASGFNGENGAQFSTMCDATTRGEGGLGASATGLARGGRGGSGGTMDTYCNGLDMGLNATPGLPGAAGGGGALGGAGGAGLCQGSASASRGRDGVAGAMGADGTGGTGGAPGQRGDDGQLGTGGSGGGGGGGGGGSDCGTDSTGAGGGGGGAGGAAATVAGTGGSPGAESIAILLVGSSPTFVNVHVELGVGGAGGDGGAGASGQPGGAGGHGGLAAGDGGAGGNGGRGGPGGASGAGGGGGGGATIGVDTDSLVAPIGITYSGGVAGAGGNGGGTGSSGSAGAAGPVMNVRAAEADI